MPDPLDPAALADLRAMVGDEADLYAELLDTFVTDADQYLTELEDAASAHDVAALVRPAHSLKSNAMNVGAHRLAELSRALEADARAASVAAPADRVGQIREELERVRPAVVAEREAAARGA